MTPANPHWRILRLGEQVRKLVDGELVKFGGVLDGIENFLLSSLVEMGPYVAVERCIRIDGTVSLK